MSKVINVTNQEMLDAISVDADVKIIVQFGDWHDPAIIRHRYRNSVHVVGDYWVTARGNSTVTARENSTVTAWGNSTVTARENSTVTAWENSTVTAWGNSQIVDRTDNDGENLTIKSPKARIIYDPRTIEEYMYAYGLDFDEEAETVKLYKAVHKDRNDGKYHADYRYTFLYEIGEMVEADFLDEDPHIDCGHGIHMAYPEWCVLFGNDWDDIAILELEVKKSDIIVPYGGIGKVRALRAKVLREYPLDECGVEGHVLAKRLARKEGR